MPRPFYRWKSFWLGILVLGFLAWAAWDSTRFISGAAFSKWTLSRVMGHTFVVEWPDIVSLALKPYRYPLSAGISVEKHSNSWKAWGGKPVGMSDVAVLSLFLLTWSGFLALRWRRQRILTKTPDAAPAH